MKHRQLILNVASAVDFGGSCPEQAVSRGSKLANFHMRGFQSEL
jgi:hypothetical protein|tara:strand:- start:87 stop:218 length:132 start_codon:yes stop_codon:yes gene_type:complete